MSSLRALAKSLGLSITTVSRALDNYSDVSEATRKRVRAAADEAGYRPNAAARRLRKGSTEMVTMVLPTEPGQFNEPLYIELLAAMGKRLAGAGYDLTLLASPPGTEEIKTYRRLVEGRRTDGLIVVRTRRDDARIRWLLDADFPFVAMGRTDVPGPSPGSTATARPPSATPRSACWRWATGASRCSARRRPSPSRPCVAPATAPQWKPPAFSRSSVK